MSKRFPWNRVEGWSVSSCADGTLRVEPKWIGGTPGLFTRLRMADWLLQRLTKRKHPNG